MTKKRKDKDDFKSEIVQKFTLIYFIVLLGAIFIILQILFLQLIKREDLEEQAATTKGEEVPPNRGDICDINGRILATSLPYYEIRMDTQSPADSVFTKHVDSLAYYLSELFKDKTKSEYLKKLKTARENKDRYLFIQSNVTHTQYKEIKKFPIFKKGKYKGGLIAVQKTDRILPHFILAERTIGYVNDETNKKIGIEGAFNEELKGKNGYHLVQKMSGGGWRPIKFDNEVEPEDGKDVITTIDINVQDLVETTLKNQLIKLKANYGTVVLMEVSTGEVRAIANLTRKNDSTYIEDFNYAIGRLYEPGSTFKLPAIMAAFEKSDIELDEKVDTKQGELKIGDFILRDSQKGGYGVITVQQAFELSSNIGISTIVYNQFKDDPEEFFDRLYSMNINQKLGIEDIKGEVMPEIKYPGDEFWSGVSLRQMAIGYELQLAPIQLLAFYNAIANDGVLIKPIFVKGIRQYGEIVEEFETEVLNTSICSKKTLAKVKILLEGVIENGTACNLKSENFKIAGKTGTSQIAYGSTGYISETGIDYNASFVGYYPADNPKYSCIVVINSPKEVTYYGGQAAGPIFNEIAEKLYATDYDMQSEKEFNLDNMPLLRTSPKIKSGFTGFLDIVLSEMNINTLDENKSSDWVKVSKIDSTYEYVDLNVEKGIVPDVLGMGAREAIYLLENRGLKVKIDGRGTVNEQSLPAGSVITQGKTIKITLS
jgi:cell division protein FtsI (penicillin-binding protein 3)